MTALARGAALLVVLLGLQAPVTADAQAPAQTADSWDSSPVPTPTAATPAAAATPAPSQDSSAQQFREKLRALQWVAGPKTVTIAGNSTLAIPAGYVFLDAANTAKFEELNQNLSSGREVMLAPQDLHWSAYLWFEDAGYVKDDEKIDAPAILKALQAETERSNEQRQRRGWQILHVAGWDMPPAYNTTTKRLEWATLLKADNAEGVNFFTKILGRRGYTSVVLAASTDGTPAAVADLNRLLSGYQFNSGDTYSEWRPGEKVAKYGLAGLIVGGAALAAAKTGLLAGLLKVVLAGAAATWKLIVAGVAILIGGLKSFVGRKESKR